MIEGNRNRKITYWKAADRSKYLEKLNIESLKYRLEIKINRKEKPHLAPTVRRVWIEPLLMPSVLGLWTRSNVNQV